MLKLKKIITCVLITACLVCSVGVASACNEGKDYSEDITKLQQQLETLLNQNGNYSIEIEKLQQKIDDLKNQNGDFSSEIDKLEQQIAAQQKLIESLQNIVNVEPKTYKIGETFTYSYQGMDYFSLTLEATNSTKANTFIVKNLNMSNGAPINTYVRAVCYNKADNDMYVATFTDDPLDCGSEYRYVRSFFDSFDKAYLGFPSGESGVIPYAIFDLTA